MKTSLIVAIGIIFIAVGLLFSALALRIGRPESVEKAPISKPCSKIFDIIGSLTLILGILDLVFFRSITKSVLQGAALVYLIAVTILFIVFSSMIGALGGKKK